MAIRKKVSYNGRQVDAEVIEFKPPAENWTQYELADGTTLKVKTVLLEVLRLVGEYNPTNGDPIYMFQAQQILAANSPDSLKKKPN